MGRRDEALALLRERELQTQLHSFFRSALTSLRALLEGNYDEALRASEIGIASIHRGGEELFYFVRQLAFIGETERALSELERVIEFGFFCYPAIKNDPWLNSLRQFPKFAEMLATVHRRSQDAEQLLLDAGGVRLLA